MSSFVPGPPTPPKRDGVICVRSLTVIIDKIYNVASLIVVEAITLTMIIIIKAI